jgi:hypothetical protein
LLLLLNNLPELDGERQRAKTGEGESTVHGPMLRGDAPELTAQNRGGVSLPVLSERAVLAALDKEPKLLTT